MPAPITQGNIAVSPPAVEEEPKEDGEEFEDLSAMLEHLGLSEYKRTFDEERIDIESFVRRVSTNINTINVVKVTRGHFKGILFGILIFNC